MANWGAFSRDFGSSFSNAYRAVSDGNLGQQRVDLAKKADARAQRSSDRAEADAAAESEYFANIDSGGSVAAAAAPAPTSGSGGRSRAAGIMTPPNKLGAVTETGEPVPASPEEAEAAEMAEAADRGFTPAPPAAVPANSRAKYGDNPVARAEAPASALPVSGYKGRITPRIRADMDRREQQQYTRAKEGRAEALDTRAADTLDAGRQTDNETQVVTLNEKRFTWAKAQAEEQMKSAFAMSQQFKPDQDGRSVLDPAVEPQVAPWIDSLKRAHDVSPDGRTLDIAKTPKGYAVTTIDEGTRKPVGPPQMFSTIGELKKGTQLLGMITMGPAFAEYSSKASLDAVNIANLDAQGKSFVNDLRQRIGNATMEERMDPRWQQETNALITKAEDTYPDAAFITTKVPMENPRFDPNYTAATAPDYDPEDPRAQQFLQDDRGRTMMETAKRPALRDAAGLAQPNTSIKLPDGGAKDANEIIGGFLANPTPYIQKFGSAVDAIEGLKQSLITNGLEPDVANVLVSRAVADLPKAIEQRLAIDATPRSVVTQRGLNPEYTAPVRGTIEGQPGVGAPAAATPAGAPAAAIPLGPQQSQRAFTPGEPDIRARRPDMPVQIDPRARQIGSPFAR